MTMATKLVLALTLAVATPAVADAQTVVADAASVADALRLTGYRADVSKSDDGDPLVRSGASGVNFAIVYYGCTKGAKCTTVQFYAGFSTKTVTLAKINEWNTGHRFGRAYIDKEGDPCLEMDVDLDAGGMTRALFLDHVGVWDALLGSFATFVR